MRTAWLIAANTARETIRNKVLYNVLLFAALVIVLSVTFGEWSVFARVQVMQDFGLATMSISGLLLAVFIGVGMLGREISSKTIYGLATKPVQRSSVIVGKYAGLLAVLFLDFAVMSLFFVGALWFVGQTLGASMLPAVLLIWAEMAVVVAVAVLFSTVTTPTLAAMFTLGFYVAGHFNDMLDVALIEKSDPLLSGFLQVLYYLLPNLEHFNVRARVVYGMGVDAGYMGFALAYGALYVVLFLALASAASENKDL